MCGFVGAVALNGMPASLDTVERMSSMLHHRGPDDSGTYLSGSVGLGFRRLSILDLTAGGHQPMSTPDGAVTIVFNGEIYNYIELRRQLASLGHEFRSSGDTEVLLRAYCQWGVDCLSRLNGMWAFVIHDQRTGKLFGSRDRFGIKPLFCHRGRDHVLFASEIKAIRASGLYRDETDWGVAAAFLVDGRLDESDETFYKGIRQLPAGTAFELGLDGRYREWRYWDVEASAAPVPGDPAAAFAELFEDAMRLHMRSDVPVGVNLSGGLDSTSIICASARIRQKAGATGQLMAFSYIAPEFDESAYIGDTVTQSGATLVRLQTGPERVWGDLERMLWFQDEPVHSITAVVGFQLMRLAVEHGVKVILNGQGADETIAGYPSYFKSYWHTLLARGGLVDAGREIGAYAKVHGGTVAGLYLKQLRHLALTQVGRMKAYQGLREWFHRRPGSGSDWFTGQLHETVPRAPVTERWDLNSTLADSVRRSPLPLYLRVEDRNSMAHSIEVRLPFLDYRLVELEFGLPLNWKMRGPWNKYVLREAMRGRIPESVRTRVDKMGFPTPAGKWFANTLYEPLCDVLTSRRARERGIYNTDIVLRDLQRHHRGDADFTNRIFDVAQFEVWSDSERVSARLEVPQGDALVGVH